MAELKTAEHCAFELEVFPGLVAACGRRYTDHTGRRYSPIMALAVWLLARHIDPTGRGRVHLADLQRAGAGFWTRDTFYRAMRDAVTLGLMRQVTRRRDGAQMVTCAGVARVAMLLELPSVGARKVHIPLEALAGSKKFKAALWSAWQAGRSAKAGRPITRSKLRAMCGMPESTQRSYEAGTVDPAGERVTDAAPNAIIMATHATLSNRAAAREHVHGGCYIDRITRALLRPIGNTYSSSLAAGSRSRARKVNRFLSHRPGALLPPGSPKRLFYADARKAEQAARAGRAEDVPMVPTGQQAGRVTLWRPVWDSWTLKHVAGVV